MESSRQRRGDGGVGLGLGLGLGYTQIETAAECLGRYEIYHVVKEIIGFVLYMHHQIPAILQQLETEFCNMREECKSLESSVLTPTELKATSQRKHNGRMRELKQGIRRLEKLMNAISSLLSSFQLFLEEIPDIQGLILVLGASLVRPQHVYEMLFSHGKVDSISSKDYTKSRVAEALSRKAIRALISNGAGGDSYAGPMKLFLLVKAPANFNLPRHFLPKRDFRYSKKVLPFQLQIKCKTSDQAMDVLHSQTASSADQLDPNSNDLIWFQCRHTVKGLASKTSHEEG